MAAYSICRRPEFRCNLPQTACGQLNLFARHNFSKPRVDFVDTLYNILINLSRVSQGYASRTIWISFNYNVINQLSKLDTVFNFLKMNLMINIVLILYI
jgi:hypothetical protein